MIFRKLNSRLLFPRITSFATSEIENPEFFELHEKPISVTYVLKECDLNQLKKGQQFRDR